MRIAMLTNNYKPFVGGVPISIERQAKALRELGHEVMIFAPDYGDTEEEEGVIRCRIRKRRMANGMVYPRLFSPETESAFRREKFDCIHVHQPVYMGNMALYLGRKYHIPIIYTYHTRYEDYLHYLPVFREEEKAGAIRRLLIRAARERVIPWYMRWFTNRCDTVLAPTKGMKRDILLNGTSSLVEVFPTGLDEGFFEEHKETAIAVRKQYGKDKKYLFCTVSRLEEEKNLFFLLKGMKKLKEEGMESFRLLLIGEGSLKGELEKTAVQWGLEDCVTFTGNIPNEELPAYLQASDLFLFSSKSETQGIVIQEALASGCPVIAIRANGVEEAIEDGCNGYLAKEDVHEWCMKIWKALEGPGRGKMREEAKKSVSGYRNLALAAREEQIYTNCMEAKWKEETAGEREHAAVSFSRLFKIT